MNRLNYEVKYTCMNSNKNKVEVWTCKALGLGFYELGKIQLKGLYEQQDLKV